MSQGPRVSGFREQLPSNDSSWSSHYPPEYRPFPEGHPAANAIDPAVYGDHVSLQHRISNKEAPVSPEIDSPGLISVWDGDGDKEVYYPPPAIEPPRPHFGGEGEHAHENPRYCGMRRKWLIILILAIACIVIALAVGLGVGLGAKKHSSASKKPTPSNSTASIQYEIGGAINPAYYSTTGAFNGSGIALASQSYQSTNYGDIVMYFQHWTGTIRWQYLSDEGSWLGGDTSSIVASDAKNGTPISAVSYALNGSSTWHIFYINEENLIRQRSNSNTTNVWVDGPINAQNLTALAADQVGMQACWYGSDYGDSDYVHTPLPQDGDSSNSSVAEYDDYGMHIWYASDEQTFQQLGWRQGDLNWTFQQSWTEKNGHAGVGCYSWGPGTVNYVMFANLDNTVEFWWKDTNTNLTNSTTHPINVWTNSSVAINGVNPSTSLGYTNVFYVQDGATSAIRGYNVTWAAENTTIVTADNFVVDGTPGIPGTHLSVTALPNESGGNNLYVFYQTEGTDVTEFTRDIAAGQWTELSLPIPNS